MNELDLYYFRCSQWDEDAYLLSRHKEKPELTMTRMERMYVNFKKTIRLRPSNYELFAIDGNCLYNLYLYDEEDEVKLNELYSHPSRTKET